MCSQKKEKESRKKECIWVKKRDGFPLADCRAEALGNGLRNAGFIGAGIWSGNWRKYLQKSGANGNHLYFFFVLAFEKAQKYGIKIRQVKEYQMNKNLKIVATIIMIGVFLWGAYMLLFQETKENDETEVIKAEKKEDVKGKDGKKNKPKEASLPVTVLRIKKGDLPLRLPISATADVWEKATLKAEVTGTIEKVSCSIGDKIGRGQVLIKFDDIEKRLDVESAEAGHLEAFSKYLISESIKLEEDKEVSEVDKQKLVKLKAEYEKAVKDYEKGKISESKIDAISDKYNEALVYSGAKREDIRKAADGLSGAKILLKKAKLELARCTVRSPFPAIISSLTASVGEKISTGQELVKVVNLKTLYLKGFALESEVGNLKAGTPVRVKFDAFPDKYFKGNIKSISPEIDPENKTISIYVDVENKDDLILPGMHAELDVEYKVYKDVLRVPRVAVIVRQRPLVFVVENKQAIWKYVELGEKNDENQVILSGLKEGDLVVVDGHLTLAHQSKVRVVKTLEQQ